MDSHLAGEVVTLEVLRGCTEVRAGRPVRLPFVVHNYLGARGSASGSPLRQADLAAVRLSIPAELAKGRATVASPYALAVVGRKQGSKVRLATTPGRGSHVTSVVRSAVVGASVAGMAVGSRVRKGAPRVTAVGTQGCRGSVVQRRPMHVETACSPKALG